MTLLTNGVLGWAMSINPPSYSKIHDLLATLRGLASEHVCLCGSPAAEWAYQFTGEIELRDRNGNLPHSENPDDYEAMCRPCHQRLDREKNPRVTTEAQRESGRRMSESAAKKKRRCIQCGMIGAPGAVGNHQRWYRHTGLEDVAVG